MGAMVDKLASEAARNRKLNDIEIDKQRKLQALDMEKAKEKNELNHKEFDLKKKQAENEFNLKKGQHILQFQADIRKIEAEIINTRMHTQSAVFSKFLNFMEQTLKTNEALITQQSSLYNLINNATNEKTLEFFQDKADKISILSAKDLIILGAEKVTELNLESSKEMQFLEEKLHKVLETTQNSTPLALTSH